MTAPYTGCPISPWLFSDRGVEGMKRPRIRSRRWRQLGGLILVAVLLVVFSAIVWMLFYLAQVAGFITQ